MKNFKTRSQAQSNGTCFTVETCFFAQFLSCSASARAADLAHTCRTLLLVRGRNSLYKISSCQTQLIQDGILWRMTVRHLLASALFSQLSNKIYNQAGSWQITMETESDIKIYWSKCPVSTKDTEDITECTTVWKVTEKKRKLFRRKCRMSDIWLVKQAPFVSLTEQIEEKNDE